MPSTFAHGFVPACCLLVSREAFPTLTKKKWLFLFCIGFIAGNLPDLDFIFGIIDPAHWNYYHRNFGHNLFALAGWTVLTRALLVRLVTQELKGKRGWILSASLVFSHIFFDAMGGADPHGLRTGVPLLFPFSNWEFLLPFKIFDYFQLANGISNPVLKHIHSTEFWTRAFFVELSSSFILITGWCGFYHLTNHLRARKTRACAAAHELKPQ